MVRSRAGWVVPVIASLLVCSLVAPAVLGSVAAEQPNTAVGPTAERLDVVETQEFEADRTEFQITVYENGSATWLFRYERTLSSDQERQDFEAFAEEFNTNETEMYTKFQERAVSLTESGTNATGRAMSAENFQRNARTEGFDDSLGVVEMSFRWDGFAAVDNRIVVGDIFEGGLYLGPDQRLVIKAGTDLAFANVQPEDGQLSGETLAGSDSVTWDGERSFTDNRPRVELAEAGTVTTPTETSGEPSSGAPSWLLPVGAFVVVLLLGLGAAVAYRSGMLPPSGGAAAETGAEPPSGGEGDTAGGAEAAGAAAAAGTAADSEAADAEPEPAVSDEELISDEERVIQLLEDHGGRMKQVNIVDETGWSKSKVSMLLSEMEEAGDISKLRVGRENIVSLSGHEPDAAGSPFDDE
ncbi:MAG: putative membrane protein [Natronomonas sp.]|jgi:uncharacterized membrane protein|uniref:helix-turn-helix transcriptional regulator n=1 Tax=Natronomonas sp. TaxID=2184060 RepID=UPI003988D07F